jgi:hypothetical protein
MFLVFFIRKLRIVLQESRISKPGAKVKNGVKSAKPVFKILYSPSKTQRNSPLIIRKMAITK